MSQIRISTTPNYIGWDVERPEHWTDDAVCTTVDPEIFFPETGHSDTTRQAMALCSACPVKAVCLQESLERREGFGIFGGLTAMQRAALLRKALPSRQQSDTCRAGHEYEPDQYKSNGYRKCMTCDREGAARRHKLKAAS